MFITGWHFFDRSLSEVANSMYLIWGGGVVTDEHFETY